MKTYLPKLLFIARLLCNYIRRWESKIKDNIPEESWPILDAALTACDALEVLVQTLVGTST
jgi:hypothetical protein